MAPLVLPQTRAAFEARWNVTIQTASNATVICAPELFGGSPSSSNQVTDLLNDGTISSAARKTAIQGAIASCGTSVAFTQRNGTTGLTAEVFAPVYGGTIRGNGKWRETLHARRGLNTNFKLSFSLAASRARC